MKTRLRIPLMLSTLLCMAVLVGCSPKLQINQEEFELDPTNCVEFGHVEMTLPKGFVENPNMNMGEHDIVFSGENGNIDIFDEPVTDSITNYSKESIEESYSSLIEGFEGISNFQETTIDGYSALDITYTFEVADITFIQNQVLIFGEDFKITIMFGSTFEEFADVFNACKETIKING